MGAADPVVSAVLLGFVLGMSRIRRYARVGRPVAFASALGSIALGVVYGLSAL